MAFAGKSDRKENITAAVAANIWMSNERGARAALPDEQLNYIVMDCLVGGARSSTVGVDLTRTRTCTIWRQVVALEHELGELAALTK